MDIPMENSNHIACISWDNPNIKKKNLGGSESDV